MSLSDQLASFPRYVIDISLIFIWIIYSIAFTRSPFEITLPATVATALAAEVFAIVSLLILFYHHFNET